MSQFPQSSSCKVYKFVLTGGPCSGKTTAMSRIQSYLQDCGYRVYMVPEAATMLFLNGVAFGDLESRTCQFAFQKAVITTQMHLENTFESYAQATGQNSILLCDRGTMDGRAYIDDELWTSLLDALQLNTSTICDDRYAAVFHLVTAASGAEIHYTLANNTTRTEGIEEAKKLDERTKFVWKDHPRHIIIDNTTASFRHKMLQLMNHIGGILSIPPPSSRPPLSFRLLHEPDLSIKSNIQYAIVHLKEILSDRIYLTLLAS
eukprot:gene6620-13410_t